MSHMTGARSFTGGHLLSLDSKNRINIPAGFQRILSNLNAQTITLVYNISRNGIKFLELWPESSWNEHVRIIKDVKRPRMGILEFQHLIEFYVNPAMKISMDKQGRIVIPPHIRTLLGISRVSQGKDNSQEKTSLYLVGSGKYMKLYKFEDFAADMEADRKKIHTNVYDIFSKIGAYIPEDN